MELADKIKVQAAHVSSCIYIILSRGHMGYNNFFPRSGIIDVKNKNDDNDTSYHEKYNQMNIIIILKYFNNL